MVWSIWSLNFPGTIFSVPELSRNDIFSVRDFSEQRIIGAGALQGYKPENQACAITATQAIQLTKLFS